MARHDYFTTVKRARRGGSAARWTWERVEVPPRNPPVALRFAPLLVPAPDATVEFHEVGTAVNSPRHNDASLIEPAPPETLF